jgi:hypothetical protein
MLISSESLLDQLADVHPSHSPVITAAVATTYVPSLTTPPQSRPSSARSSPAKTGHHPLFTLRDRITQAFTKEEAWLRKVRELSLTVYPARASVQASEA